MLCLPVLALTVGARPSIAATSGNGAENARVVGQLTPTGRREHPQLLVRHLGASDQTLATGGGGAVGKATVTSFGVVKAVDALTPVLLVASATGRVFQTATF